MSPRQRRRFRRRELVDVLASGYVASIVCVAGDQRFVINLDPRRFLVDDNVDVGDLDISRVEKNDIGLSEPTRRENDRAITVRGGFDDLRISDQ